MGRQAHPNGLNNHGVDKSMEVRTELTEEALAELRGLEGKAVVGVSLYEDSVAYEEEEEPVDEAERIFFDAELYLVDQTLLCIYGASIYLASDEVPLKGLDAVSETLAELAEEEDILRQAKRDRAEGLVLDFGSSVKRRVLIAVSGWALDRWEELPGGEEEFEEEFDEEDWEDIDAEEDLDDWDDEDMDLF